MTNEEIQQQTRDFILGRPSNGIPLGDLSGHPTLEQSQRIPSDLSLEDLDTHKRWREQISKSLADALGERDRLLSHPQRLLSTFWSDVKEGATYEEAMAKLKQALTEYWVGLEPAQQTLLGKAAFDNLIEEGVDRWWFHQRRLREASTFTFPRSATSDGGALDAAVRAATEPLRLGDRPSTAPASNPRSK
jgi:hypothetical protein